MRTLALASMTALLLSGLPPAPLPPAQAQYGARMTRADDPDGICAPFIRDFRADDMDRAGYGRGRRIGRAQSTPVLCATAAFPPPPPPMIAQEQAANGRSAARAAPSTGYVGGVIGGYAPQPIQNRERYAGEEVAAVRSVAEAPVSTFGVDVDTGSYSNVRRCSIPARCRPRRRCGPRRCSTISATIIRRRTIGAAVQRQRRHDDDAVERQYAAAAHRPARL